MLCIAMEMEIVGVKGGWEIEPVSKTRNENCHFTFLNGNSHSNSINATEKEMDARSNLKGSNFLSILLSQCKTASVLLSGLHLLVS